MFPMHEPAYYLRRFALTGVMILGVLSILGSGGGGGGGGTTDTTPPITTATPMGGIYGATQDVTLSSDEPATIYYSLDGNDPSVTSINTISGSSPLSGISIPAGTTVLKFFAVDSAGNTEAIKSETYYIDLVAPIISLSGSAPGPIGLLATATVSWQSNEDGTYVVELGGNGTAGSGNQIASGSVLATIPIASLVSGIGLSYAAATPLWIYVTDAVGHTGSFYVNLELKQLNTITVGNIMKDIKILPNGEKLYVSVTGSNNVIVIDTNPANGTYNTILKTITVGNNPYDIAITPDGARVYVTNSGNTISDVDSLSEIDTSTDTVTTTITLGSNTAPTGIAITPDGSRAYFLSFDGNIYVLDTDTTSITYNTIIYNISRSLLLSGEIAITPDGALAVSNWAGTIAHAVDVYDINPASTTYQQLIASPVPVITGFSGDIAISDDSAYAYVTSPYTNCGICKINLQTNTITFHNNTDYSAFQNTLALTPDGTKLLTGGVNTTTLSVFNTADLTYIGKVEVNAGISSLAITPDGMTAYAVRHDSLGSQDILVVPLQ